MIKNINEKWTMTIPVFSFITVFSSPFLNRQKQTSYVANTALFNKEFTVEVYMLAKFTNGLSKNSKRLRICFIAPDSETWSKLNGDLPKSFILHNIAFEFLSIYDISYLFLNGVGNDREIIFIFIGFNNWHTIIATIYSITLEETKSHGVVISGGDSSKRHLVSPMSIKLHSFLLILANFNRDILVNNVLFNIDKKFIIPQFNFQEKNHPYLHMKLIESVNKNKINKDSRNLHTDLHNVNVSSASDSQDVKESVAYQSNESMEESIANSSILPVHATERQE